MVRSGSGRRTACITSSTRAPLALVELGMDVEHFGDLVADAHHLIERRHRLLEDHRDAVAADAAHLGRRLGQQVVAVEQGASAGDGQLVRRQQPHDGVRRHGLAGIGFAHHADDLARRHCKRHVLDRVDAVRAGREVGGEVVIHLHTIVHAIALLGRDYAPTPAELARARKTKADRFLSFDEIPGAANL